MFNRRKELEQRIQELEKMQKKGYYGNNYSSPSGNFKRTNARI